MADRVVTPRRVRRVPLWGALPAVLNDGCAAALVDLSERGAQIEHREIVRPGQHYVLQFTIPQLAGPLHLPAQVIWSWVHRFEAGRELPLVYRSGLEFQPLPPEVCEPLAAFLAAREAAGPLHRAAERVPSERSDP